MRGKYIGPVERLQGETALLDPHPNQKRIRAQFDNMELEHDLTHGWTEYARADWEVFEPGDVVGPY